MITYLTFDLKADHIFFFNPLCILVLAVEVVGKLHLYLLAVGFIMERAGPGHMGKNGNGTEPAWGLVTRAPVTLFGFLCFCHRQ